MGQKFVFIIFGNLCIEMVISFDYYLYECEDFFEFFGILVFNDNDYLWWMENLLNEK